MEVLESTYTSWNLALVAATTIALLLAQVITAAERRLIAAAAVLLAGVFFLARAGGDPVPAVVGAFTWAAGLTVFFRSGLRWSRAKASRAGPFAALVLLPPAFFGALLVCGILLALIDGPARLAARWLGG